MSSVLGLKVKPSTETVLPRSALENIADTLRANRPFPSIVYDENPTSMMRNETSWSCATLISARTSLGKQEPPNPGPACMNLVPIRLSASIPRATSRTSASTFSQRSAIAFYKCYFGRQERCWRRVA